jgi:hypothetical protein
VKATSAGRELIQVLHARYKKKKKKQVQERRAEEVHLG